MPLPQTARLYFRPHQPVDLDAYCAMEMDAAVRKYVGGSPRTREAAENRFETTLHDRNEGLGMWATILKEDGSYVGRCGIYQHFNADNKPVPGEAALGLYIAQAFWNQGFATEAAQALIEYGFKSMRLKKIVTAVEQGNNASIHVMEKIGMVISYTEPGVRTFLHYILTNPDDI